MKLRNVLLFSESTILSNGANQTTTLTDKSQLLTFCIIAAILTMVISISFMARKRWRIFKGIYACALPRIEETHLMNQYKLALII